MYSITLTLNILPQRFERQYNFHNRALHIFRIVLPPEAGSLEQFDQENIQRNILWPYETRETFSKSKSNICLKFWYVRLSPKFKSIVSRISFYLSYFELCSTRVLYAGTYPVIYSNATVIFYGFLIGPVTLPWNWWETRRARTQNIYAIILWKSWRRTCWSVQR